MRFPDFFSRKPESEVLRDSDLQMQITKIGSRFVGKKTPWWSKIVMVENLEETVGRVDPNVLDVNLRLLVLEGTLVSRLGGHAGSLEPHAVFPPGNSETYYRVWPDRVVGD